VGIRPDDSGICSACELDDVLELDGENERTTVDAGITWRKLQQAIDEHDPSV